jgi:hypothetical protein
MKKLIFILTLFALSGVCKAQAPAPLKTRYPVSGSYAASTKTLDTCTNTTDTVYFFFDATQMIQGSIYMVAQLISGTGVVTGYLELSNDGTYWFQKSLADTINLKPTANGTKVAGLVITQNTAKYYRYRLIGHNTAAVKLKGWGISRRD